jgi:hypothetical protein
MRTAFTVSSVVLIVTVGYLATVLAIAVAKLGLATAATRLTNSVGRGCAFTRSTASATTASATPAASATTLLASAALTAGLAATLLLAFGVSLARNTANRFRIAYAIPDVVADVGISRHPTAIRGPSGLEAIAFAAIAALGAARVTTITVIGPIRVTTVAIATFVSAAISAATTIAATTVAPASVTPTAFAAMPLTTLAFRPPVIPTLCRTLAPILIAPAISTTTLAATTMAVATAAATAFTAAAFTALAVVTPLHPVATLATTVSAITTAVTITTITARSTIGMPMTTRMVAAPIAPSLSARRPAACWLCNRNRLFRRHRLRSWRRLVSEEPLDPPP